MGIGGILCFPLCLLLMSRFMKEAYAGPGKALCSLSSPPRDQGTGYANRV